MSVSTLHGALRFIHDHKYPHVENPPGCNRRAAVALIIRFRPRYPDRPTTTSPLIGENAQTFETALNTFFEQEWVRGSDPEILFIKRASRSGDRWNGHVAFPGGRRDPEDENDAATSVRETEEEVGLNLESRDCLYIGNLPERLVTTLDNAPLLVLCANVYLMLRYDTPPLYLQPTEVESAHWVPLRHLQRLDLRTFQRCDVSERFNRIRGRFSRHVLRLAVGQFCFTAIHLPPAESVYSAQFDSASEPRLSTELRPANLSLRTFWPSPRTRLLRDNPILLWGLTLGIAADFLELMAPIGLSNIWDIPTLSKWDVRFFNWLTVKFEQSILSKTAPEMQSSGDGRTNGSDNRTIATSFPNPGGKAPKPVRGSAFGNHYKTLWIGTIVALCVRSGLGILLMTLFVRKFRAHRSDWARLKALFS